MTVDEIEYTFMPKSIGSMFRFAYQYAYEVKYFVHATKDGRVRILEKSTVMARSNKLQRQDIIDDVKLIFKLTKTDAYPEYDSVELDELFIIRAMDQEIKET